MLEQPTLLIHAWNPAAGPPGALVRHILTPGGEPVGFVRQTALRAPRWLRWFERQIQEVYETPDGSLVFTLRRGWAWPAAWHVVDAEDRHVGTLRGRAMLDGLGNFLGVIESPDSQGRGRILTMQSRELGHFAREHDVTRLTFAQALEGNPFARMLLLGAVLVQGSYSI
jgi:hypothetical protein